jgi:hypothetical protein
MVCPAQQERGYLHYNAWMGLGSFLTITTRGVFSIQQVPATVNVLLERQSWFNTSTVLTNTSSEITACAPDAGVVAGLILDGNMSYPGWTYDSLAMPALTIAPQSAMELA